MLGEELTIHLQPRHRLGFAIERIGLTLLFILILAGSLVWVLRQAASSAPSIRLLLPSLAIVFSVAWLVTTPWRWLKYPLWRTAAIRITADGVRLCDSAGREIVELQPFVIVPRPADSTLSIWFASPRSGGLAFYIPVRLLTPQQRQAILQRLTSPQPTTASGPVLTFAIELKRRHRLWFGVQQAAVLVCFAVMLVACITYLTRAGRIADDSVLHLVMIVAVIPVSAFVLVTLTRSSLKYPLWRCASISFSATEVKMHDTSGACIAHIGPCVLDRPRTGPSELWFRNANKRSDAFCVPLRLLSEEQRSALDDLLARQVHREESHDA